MVKLRRDITILDATLRDGDQSPGFSLSNEEKLVMARHLERLGVDIIEAGFPASSQGQFVAVQRIADEMRTSAVSAMAGATYSDIRKAGEAIRNARRRYIHTSIATSPIHRRTKLKKSRSEILRIAIDAVSFATEYADFVEIGAEDATRTEPEFLVEFCEAVTAAGAFVVNIEDTIGYTQPQEFFLLIKKLYNEVRAFNKGAARLSVYCHNDLGLAVSNTLAGISAGAAQAEVTLLGIGERGGGTPLEEVAAALTARRDYYEGFRTSLKMKEFAEAMRTLTGYTGMSLSPNKPIAGSNAFSHTSGISRNGLPASSSTYSLLSPDDFGLPPHRLLLSRFSGISGFNACIREFTGNFSLDASGTGFVEELEFISGTERNFSVTGLLTRLFEDGIINTDIWYLEMCTYSKNRTDESGYTVSIRVMSISGKRRKAVSKEKSKTGAVLTALKMLFRIQPEIIYYSISGAGGERTGSEAVFISARYEGRFYSDESFGVDSVVLFIRSYMNIVNRISAKFQLTCA